MNKIKNIAKKIPGVKQIRRIYKRIKLKFLDTETAFTKIYRQKGWGDTDSVSGPGSDLIQAKVIIRELPKLFKEMGVATVLDIPCGDFLWMRNVDLSNIRYIGGDIVEDLIQRNKAKYEEKNIIFLHLDLIKDSLPKVDLILCRDCLVHFSFNDIFSALKNICHSKSTYLLATTFPARKSNHNIQTGEWRPLNLVAPPFNLPDPIKVINEECTEENGLYADKCLGLWRIKDMVNKLDNICATLKK